MTDFPPPGDPRPPYIPAPPASYVAPPPSQGGPVQYTQPQKKRSIWKWIVGVIVLLMLGIGGCTAALFFAVKGPIDAANDFLAAESANDLTGLVALASASPDCFGETAESDLNNFMTQVNIAGYNLNSVDVSTSNGRSTGDVSGTVESPDFETISFTMVKESGDWLVCGLGLE